MSKHLLPRMRSEITAQPIVQGGERFLVLSDQSGMANEPLCFPLVLVHVLSCFNGVSSIEEVVNRFAAEGLDEVAVRQLLELLENSLFVDTPRVQQAIAERIESFKRAPVRLPAHAGLVYPAHSAELAHYLRTIEASVESATRLPDKPDAVRAVCVPHIDYTRGAQSYGHALRVLRSLPTPDIIVIFATAHQAAQGLFHLTRKAFAIPTGVFPAAVESIDAITSSYGSSESFAEEYLHYREHSIELQLPLIRHAFRRTIPLVPILVSSFHPFLIQGEEPRADRRVDTFVQSLAGEIRRLRAAGKRVLLYSGVDLAHMGRAFGDSTSLDSAERQRIDNADRKLLEASLNQGSSAIFSHMREDMDRRRICGFPSLYTMQSVLEILGGTCSGVVSDYRQSYDQSTDCLVSFATAYWSSDLH